MLAAPAGLLLPRGARGLRERDRVGDAGGGRSRRGRHDRHRVAAAEEAEAAKKAKAADLKAQADELMQAGDYTGAAKLYNTAAGLDPSDASLPKLATIAEPDRSFLSQF